jgi:Pentapeptide repeats (8 copies)
LTHQFKLTELAKLCAGSGEFMVFLTTWNDWKKQNPAIFIYPNLSDATLSRANLSDANLGKANLLGAWAGHSFVVCAEPDGECRS